MSSCQAYIGAYDDVSILSAAARAISLERIGGDWNQGPSGYELQVEP